MDLPNDRRSGSFDLSTPNTIVPIPITSPLRLFTEL